MRKKMAALLAKAPQAAITFFTGRAGSSGLHCGVHEATTEEPVARKGSFVVQIAPTPCEMQEQLVIPVQHYARSNS